MEKKRKKNYINNADFLQALVEYKEKCRGCNSEEKPQIPRYIGEAILLIATRLSTKPNFYSYTFREDMIMDAVDNCLLYMHNFDENKTQNPFAYFTQICWFAFLRRIAKEKKQMYIKYKMSHEMIGNGDTYEGSTNEIAMNLNNNVEYINDFIEDFETKMNKTSTSSKRKGRI